MANRSGLSSALNAKIRKILQFEGALVPTLSPFDDAGSVNVGMIGLYVAHLKKIGVSGIFMHGTAGEGYSLTLPEKILLAKAWVAENEKQKAGLLITVNVSSTVLSESVELCRELEALGVDAIGLLPSLYYKPRKAQDVVAYLKAHADAAPQTPLIYYHIPSFGKIQVDLHELIGRGLEEVPAFCGMKFTHGDLCQLTTIQTSFRNQFKVFAGFEEILLPSLAGLRVNSAICAIFNMETAVKAYKRILETKDLEEARGLQEGIVKETKALKTGNFIENLKLACDKEGKALGLQFGKPRPPVLF